MRCSENWLILLSNIIPTIYLIVFYENGQQEEQTNYLNIYESVNENEPYFLGKNVQTSNK